jgi:hypothetical protein
MTLGGVPHPAEDVHNSAAEVGCGFKLRRTQREHMFSASPSNSDIARCSQHVSNGQILLQKSVERGLEA